MGKSSCQPLSDPGCGLFLFNEIETVAHTIVISVMAVNLITAVHFRSVVKQEPA